MPLSRFLSILTLAVAAGVGAAPAQVLLVRRGPNLDGLVEGSVQVLAGEDVTLAGASRISGDLLVPGLPEIRVERRASIGEVLTGDGQAGPRRHRIALLGTARLERLVVRTDPVALPVVSAPQRPAGRRDVELTPRRRAPGDFATIRNLNLHAGAGEVAVPPGSYGSFSAHGGSAFALGHPGAAEPAAYDFQDLMLNGGGTLVVRGPVILNLGQSLAIARVRIGEPAHPEWLQVRIAGGGLTLNHGAEFFGYVEAPDGLVAVHDDARLTGGSASARLSVSRSGSIRAVALATERAAAALPYATSFEAGQGFASGPLDGQDGWRVEAGAAEIVAAAAYDGFQAIELKAGPTAAAIEQRFAHASGLAAGPLFGDFHLRPVVGPVPEDGSLLEFRGATVGFVRSLAGASPAVRVATDAGVAWWPALAGFEVDAMGAAQRWVRLTARLDPRAGTWDLSVDGRLAFVDLPLDAARIAEGGIARLRLRGAAGAPSRLDFLFAGFDHPLFADADRDGIEDAWESEHGLDPAIDDRAGDPDGDGWGNVQEFLRGSSPRDFFDGVQPLAEPLHGGGAGPDDDLALLVRRPDGTPWVGAPVTFQVAEGQRRLSRHREATTGGLAVEVRADSSGVARVYLDPLVP